MRVAYQAGVVKALHDSGLRFSVADGASGGTMNLAALLGGATPDQLCARWRTLRVSDFVSMRPMTAYARFPRTGALGDFDGIERSVFPHLGIDAAKARRARGIRATFNVCDFGEKIVIPVPHAEISHELLLAGISLPLATPPVRYLGRTWTDAVWIRDSNLMAAVAAGANELWVAWCIGNIERFSDGLLEQYVHMIEMAAIGRFNEELATIAAINEATAARKRRSSHNGPITVHVIRPEKPLPLDPDFLAGRIDAATLISYGYRDAMRYLADGARGSPLSPSATKMQECGEGVSFRETMIGRITFGETDPEQGFRSNAAIPVALHGTIDIDDVAAFVRDPDHRGDLAGHIEMHRKGGWLPAASGRFGLFTPTNDPRLTHMVYEMVIVIDGRRHLFSGRKHVRFASPFALWRATTTLYVQLHDGDSIAAPVVAAGRLSLGPAKLIALLSTLRATNCPGLPRRVGAIWKFFRFFAGELMRTYVTHRPR